jgi:hypothetical protein
VLRQAAVAIGLVVIATGDTVASSGVEEAVRKARLSFPRSTKLIT